MERGDLRLFGTWSISGDKIAKLGWDVSWAGVLRSSLLFPKLTLKDIMCGATERDDPKSQSAQSKLSPRCRMFSGSQLCSVTQQRPRSHSSMCRWLCQGFAYKTFFDAALSSFFFITTIPPSFPKVRGFNMMEFVLLSPKRISSTAYD
jgi:hypothetical protein